MGGPCKDCVLRIPPNCHEWCEMYNEYVEENKKRLEQQYKESKARAEYREYRDRVCKERR